MGIDLNSLSLKQRAMIAPEPKKTHAQGSMAQKTAIPEPYEPNTDGNLPNAELEHDKTPALGATVQRKTEGIRRVRVRFTGYRVRPLDPDNFAGSVKDLLDGLRHAEIIPGDEPERIILETEQVRVGTFSEEKTIIEVAL